MNLKNACKIGLFMSVPSVVLLFIAHLLDASTSTLTYFRYSYLYPDELTLPDYQPLSLFRGYLAVSLMQYAGFGFYLIGLNFLLLGMRKPLHKPTVTAKASYVIAVALFGIGTVYIIWQNVRFYTFFNDISLLEPMVLQTLIYDISMVLCGVSLCIFVLVKMKKNAARIAAVAAIVFHCLIYFFETLEVACKLYRFLKFETSDISSLTFILQLAYCTVYYTGIFLWIAAALLFLFTSLKWAPMADVQDWSPEPLPVPNVQAPLPEA